MSWPFTKLFNECRARLSPYHQRQKIINFSYDWLKVEWRWLIFCVTRKRWLWPLSILISWQLPRWQVNLLDSAPGKLPPSSSLKPECILSWFHHRVGHAIVAMGDKYTIVMENGPARKKAMGRNIQVWFRTFSLSETDAGLSIQSLHLHWLSFAQLCP